MRFGFVFLIICVFTVSPAGAKTKSVQESKIYDAIVLKVIDGDTLKAKVKLWSDLEKIANLRIRGIDTPELRSKCAQEKKLARRARDKLKQILGIKKRSDRPEILLHNVAPGKYHRYLADVFTAKGQNVAEALIKAGLARLYLGGKRASWCPRVGARSAP